MVTHRRPNQPLQQTGRTLRLLTRAATGCGRQLSGKVVSWMERK